jgi:hypothetical protein
MTALDQHRPGCRRIDCRGCRVRTHTDHRITTTATVPTTSRWRCRDHPDQPVTWKGTGCPECAAERART